jgi:hypothetical protein
MFSALAAVEVGGVSTKAKAKILGTPITPG